MRTRLSSCCMYALTLSRKHAHAHTYTQHIYIHIQAAQERTEAAEAQGRELYEANNIHTQHIHTYTYVHIQAAQERTEAAEARGRELYEANKRLEAHVHDLESRKRAPLYQKKQEVKLTRCLVPLLRLASCETFQSDCCKLAGRCGVRKVSGCGAGVRSGLRVAQQGNELPLMRGARALCWVSV